MNENLSLTHEELLICERLRSLRMSGMADAFESQMLDPNADLAPFIERFTEIVNHEWQILRIHVFQLFGCKFLTHTDDRLSC